MKKVLTAAICAALISLAAFTQADPFQSLQGPVAKVEKWSYKTEEKFGDTVEVWDAHSVATYNADKNPVESINYAETGSIEQRYIRTFDSSGQLIEAEQHNWLGNLESKILCKHEGNVRISRSYNADGDLESASDTELDTDGNMLRTTMYDVDTGDVSAVWETSYTREREPSSARMYNGKGELSATLDHRYGVDGMDAISTFVVYILGSKFMSTETGTMLVKIDEHGNWTEKRSYEHKERFGKMEWFLTNIYRRKITYR